MFHRTEKIIMTCGDMKLSNTNSIYKFNKVYMTLQAYFLNFVISILSTLGFKIVTSSKCGDEFAGKPSCNVQLTSCFSMEFRRQGVEFW